MKNKFYSYMGLAKKSGNLLVGTDTCTMSAKKGKIKLLIVSGDIAPGTVKRIQKLAKDTGCPLRQWDDSGGIDQILGRDNCKVIGITDDNFAKVILQEIDSKKEV